MNKKKLIYYGFMEESQYNMFDPESLSSSDMFVTATALKVC